MNLRKAIATTGLAVVLAGSATAQHSQVKAIAVNPNSPGEVWVTNRDNNSVSVVDAASGTVLDEISVGVFPRALAFNADGTKLLVTNQRGNVPVTAHFLNFTGAEVRGSVSVIDVATKTVSQTLTDFGTEPYGVALSPNGEYFVVSSQRSAELFFLDADTLNTEFTFAYDANLNFIPAGSTIEDLDEDRDGIADLETPRGFTILDDNQTIYVTHLRSPYLSVLDVTLDGNGVASSATLNAKIQQDIYPYHPLNNPVPIQTVKSQGNPRFSGDIAISPDGSLGVVPSSLTNVNHDVNHNWNGAIDGDFANRVYPALSIIDTVTNTFNQGGDNSGRVHHELTDPTVFAQHQPFGPQGKDLVSGTPITLGGVGVPQLGTTADFRVTGGKATDIALLWYGTETNIPIGNNFGTLLALFNSPIVVMTPDGAGNFDHSYALPALPTLEGEVAAVQAAVLDPFTTLYNLSNGVRTMLSSTTVGLNDYGHRAGLPSKAFFNDAGDRLISLNRGSEDIFVFEVVGDDLRFMNVFPPRVGFDERAPLDTTTPMGDLPLGWTVVDDASTAYPDDALIYVINEVTTSLSVLRIDWNTGTITEEASQIHTLLGPDLKTASERIGQEIFEDASRPQTTGNFNNSCASCHYEGLEDGNVWQRPAGPRTTMPTYGGPKMTGLLLWKGTRINFGETGPMFGGENGGHGLFSDVEQQGLIDYQNVIPVPLNPNWDNSTSSLTSLAAFGQDLFFGENNTGLNPSQRASGCAVCHPRVDLNTGEQRFFTVDNLDSSISETLDFGFNVSEYCFELKPNIAAKNLRNVNSAVNSDENNDGFPDPDRNVDGYSDIESYVPMNVDEDDDFQRDDPNSYMCPLDPYFDPDGSMFGFQTFAREPKLFSVPTKLGVFHTGPYMHDNSLMSLRHLLDPQSQMFDPTYGSSSYVTTFKWYNEFHDLRGHEDLVPGSSKVQLSLNSTDVDADIDAILAFVQSL